MAREEPEESKTQKRLAVIRYHVLKGAVKVLPYGAQVIASAAAYTLGVTATQVVGYCLRISCCTPVLGPALGFVGVGFASTLSGHAALHARKLCEQGGNPLKKSFWEPIVVEEAIIDAVLGAVVFKAMGGRFSSLMPSDLRHPGALAFESIPARNDDYAGPGVKRELARIFKRDGCHHCGSHKGPVIGDHMPPNKVVYGPGRARARASGKGAGDAKEFLIDHPVLVSLRNTFGFGAKAPRQRFYPQCQRCSLRQAAALRLDRRVLVLHLHTPRHRPEHLSGIFVGLGHTLRVSGDSGSGSSGGGGLRASIVRWSPFATIASAGGQNKEEAAGEANRHQTSLPPHPMQLVDHQKPLQVGDGRDANGSPDVMSASLGEWAGRGSPGRGERSRMAGNANKVSSPAQDSNAQAQAAFQRHFSKQQGYSPQPY